MMGFSFDGDDDTTGIENVDTNAAVGNEAIYTLQGVRVERPLKAGVYIINGKKVILK